MRRLQPPIHLLQAFVTTAHFGSISRAAQALHLTQSAVSKQVQDLEKHLGIALFERVRQGVTPTPAGRRYEASVRRLLAQLESATLEAIASAEQCGSLQLAVLPAFSSRVLIPRLPQLAQQHPELVLQFVPYTHGYDFNRPDLDCAIRFGDGHWPGAPPIYLTGKQVMLIAPPAPHRGGRWRRAQDVQGQVLLHHMHVPDAWEEWCNAQGVRNVNAFAGPQLDDYQALIRAVSVGLGVALVPECLVADDVARGIVTAPLRAAHVSRYGYWLCHPEDRASFEPLVKFRDWLLAQFGH